MSLLLPLDDNGNALQLMSWGHSHHLPPNGVVSIPYDVEVVTLYSDSNSMWKIKGRDAITFLPARTMVDVPLTRKDRAIESCCMTVIWVTERGAP